MYGCMCTYIYIIKFDCTMYYANKVFGLVTVANFNFRNHNKAHPNHLLSPSSSNAASLVSSNPID